MIRPASALLADTLLVIALLTPAAGWAQAPSDTPAPTSTVHPSPAPDAAAAPDDAQSSPGNDDGTPAPARPTPTPAPPPATWEQRGTARLQVLDKVDAQSTTITVPVGGTGAWRGLSIDVKSCYARPADQAADATAFLIVTDHAAQAPSFVGWMLAAEPSVNLMEHPVYDVRVLGCGT